MPHDTGEFYVLRLPFGGPYLLRTEYDKDRWTPDRYRAKRWRTLRAADNYRKNAAFSHDLYVEEIYL